MVSVARIIPPPKPQRNTTHYYEALEGVLTKRFMVAAQFITYACWIASVVIGIRATNIGWIWWLLPFRMVPMLFGLFAVLILRKVKKLLHVDNLQYPNLISELFDRIIGSAVFLRVFLVYSLSSITYYWLYKSQMGSMTLTVKLRTFEPPILNERYIYMTLFSLYVSFAYSLLHVICDYDHLRFRIQTMDVPARKRIMSKMNDLSTLAVAYAIIATFTFPIFYFIFRSTIWGWCLYFARFVFHLHRSNSYGASPFGIKMVFDTFFSSVVIFWLWELTNTAFSVYMSLKPLHNGQFISERSSNKNETLVTGLSVKTRPLLRIMAFQELWLVALNSKERRVSIYSDISHNSSYSSRWETIQKECLSVINDIVDKLKVKPESKPQQTQQVVNIDSASNSVLSVKQDESIFANDRGMNGGSNKRLMDNFQDKQAQHSQHFIGILDKVWSMVHKWLENYSQITKRFLATPFGYPFRCTIERRINYIIPSPLLVYCSILSLANFISKSLEEDEYGIVHRYIPEVLHSLEELLTLIEKFTQSPPRHWTDVSQGEPDLSSLRQAHEVAEGSFEQIVDSFSAYLSGMTLSDEVKKRIQKLYNQ